MAQNTETKELYDNHGNIDLGGSSNAYTAAVARSVSGYYKGLRICGKANHSNNGASTLNLITEIAPSGLGAVAIRKSGTAALVGGEIIEDQYYDFTYDEANGFFQVLNPSQLSDANPQFTTIELGHASDTTLSRAAAGVLAVEGAVVRTAGKETIWVPAGAMIPRTSFGPGAAVTTETATNLNMLVTLNFDQTLGEAAQILIAMPKSWDEGNISFQPYWTADSGSGGVAWMCDARALSDDDAIDQDYGSSGSSIDTLTATGDLCIGAESSGFAPAGTPSEGDMLLIRVYRDPANGSDTLNADARLIGVKIFYTTNAPNDT